MPQQYSIPPLYKSFAIFLQAADSPAVKLTGSPNNFYTLMMVDVDAPNGQGATGNINFLHWMVANIPGGTSSRHCDVPQSAVAAQK
jgi:phosphatidylethanolamine-binding protein (PEBP) family uncharacterized protein